MHRLAVVLAITAAMLVSGKPRVEDPSDPEGLSEIEILTPPPLYNYKEFKGDGYEVERRDVEQDYREELNTELREYLDFLETWRGKGTSSDKGAIETMTLLIVYSWIDSSLKPELKLLRGVIPTNVDDKTSLDLVKEGIGQGLDARNTKTPLVNSILLYSKAIFQAIKRDLQDNMKIYGTDVDYTKISDGSLRAKVIEVNKKHQALYVKNKRLFDYHLITLKMILQSYIGRYNNQELAGKTNIVLTSSDGLINKEFPIPSPQFEEQMVEDEMEGEWDTEDTLNEEQPAADENKKERNTIIQKYFQSVKKIQEEVLSSPEQSDALNTVKLLIVQSWIYMSQPDLNFLKNVVPFDEEKTSEDVKKNIELDLMENIKYNKVADAIVYYGMTLINSIRNQLHTQGLDLVSEIDARQNTISELRKGPMKEMQLKIRDGLVRNWDELRTVIEFHEMTLRMSVQSYVFDFLIEPYPETVTIKSTRGQVNVPLPPLDLDTFEEMAFADIEYI